MRIKNIALIRKWVLFLFALTVMVLSSQKAFAFSGNNPIAAGNLMSIALRSDGAVWTWGSNAVLKLGDGTIYNRTIPVQALASPSTKAPPYLANVVSVATGMDFTMALRQDGSIWCVGANLYYQCTGAVTLTDVKAIDGGHAHGLALKSDGTVWAWGRNNRGQIGSGTYSFGFPPVQVLTKAKAIAAGQEHSVALKSDGTVWTWGFNGYGQLGNGTGTESNAPLQVFMSDGVTPLTNVVAIAAGDNHTLALVSDGTVWAWGVNLHEQLGDGTTTHRTRPVQVKKDAANYLTSVEAIDAGIWHSMALLSDGTVMSWGKYQYENGTTPSIYPVEAKDLNDVKAIAAGRYHSLALKSEGTLWAWGNNWNGELGDGTIVLKYVPVKVRNLTHVGTD